MSEYLIKYIIVHLACALIGLTTTLFTEKYIKVVNLLFASIFGPVYMFHEWANLDAIIIDLRGKQK